MANLTNAELKAKLEETEAKLREAESKAAEAEAKAEEAESKAAEAEAKAEEAEVQRVEIFIPKGFANDEPNYFIGINGKNYILPKGKKSLVPPEVAAEYERARKAQEKLDEHIDEMLSATE